MTDFLLELLSEEIPARMQDGARAELGRLFAAQMAAAGLPEEDVTIWSTPRRLALIARGLPLETATVSEEFKGPRTSAPPQALEGFLRKTGLTQDQLEDRDGVWFATVEKPGRSTRDMLAEAIPAIVRGFAWPKSMRWGRASSVSESLRWVRPLQGIVAILGEELVPCEVDGIASGFATRGHRFHHSGDITIGGAHDYAEKLRACHVIVDQEERRAIIRDACVALTHVHRLSWVEDEALVAENAGLTEWPVPLLGDFDPAFLEVPPEVVRLTLATNQKYFVASSPSGEDALRLAPAFICTANIEASDGGAAIVAGNRKVLAARLSDARFFWEQDKKTPLAAHAEKLSRITFHEKLGTVAAKVERVAKLARWLVEEGIVKPSPLQGRGLGEGAERSAASVDADLATLPLSPTLSPEGEREKLADLAEQAARLCKADLVTEMVGEFPELQGVMGGYYAHEEKLHPAVADAIRDHYKPVGQGDAVPTAPVTVAVSLADKLDTIFGFFLIQQKPTGSKDPFALRRAALGVLALSQTSGLRLPLSRIIDFWENEVLLFCQVIFGTHGNYVLNQSYARQKVQETAAAVEGIESAEWIQAKKVQIQLVEADDSEIEKRLELASGLFSALDSSFDRQEILDFFADRLKVQQREAGVRHDLIDAVFAIGEEDDLVRLLARVKALQAFIGTAHGANLLAGYKRAANILKKEGRPLPSKGGVGVGDAASGSPSVAPTPGPSLGREGEMEPAEAALIAALDAAEPAAAAAVAQERFEEAMAALASLREPIDKFFETVTVNDSDANKRQARLALLSRLTAAVNGIADFSKIEG